jgi:ATP-dependent Clp protease protease subunit
MTDKVTVYIKFSDYIDTNSVEKMTQLVLEQLSQGVERFVFLMSSPGGHVIAGISAYNFLMGIPAEVITHNYGSVDSIATVLFCAGSKRLCVPYASFTIHGVTLEIKSQTKYNEKKLGEHIASLRTDREIMSRVISGATGMSFSQVDHDILEGIVLNSKQALEYGLVNEIKKELFEKGAKVLDIA